MGGFDWVGHNGWPMLKHLTDRIYYYEHSSHMTFIRLCCAFHQAQDYVEKCWVNHFAQPDIEHYWSCSNTMEMFLDN
jgi:hypothetical protein